MTGWVEPTRPAVSPDTVTASGMATRKMRWPSLFTHGPPRLGEHTCEVLAGLGFTVAEIDALVTGT